MALSQHHRATAHNKPLEGNEMKKITITAAILATGLLGACTLPTPVTTVNAFNGDSVSIRVNTAMRMVTTETRAAILADATAQAADICRRGHRKQAQFVSRKFYEESDYDYGNDYLFLCLN